ncbi:LSU ribosomal protein L29p (L35e) [Christensenella hongkongensis]|uniref:Large ribosomal subunit protein uL29 n=2 Tax=Christensenella hongkongensis TaxID=270498 RepID=A0A0M2NKB5_9FIRM|nr:LSU ribosomal protein L29p (L35e) [Christensenella hongkongensis]
MREMTKDELIAKLSDLKTEFFNLRFQLATGQLNNPSSIQFVKKDIARVKTVLKEMELNSQKVAE